MKNPMKNLLKIAELSKRTGIRDEILFHYIEEEWITPCELHEKEFYFDDEDLTRALLIQELQRDFEINEESIPVILNLLDQVYALRKQIQLMMGKKSA